VPMLCQRMVGATLQMGVLTMARQSPAV